MNILKLGREPRPYRSQMRVLLRHFFRDKGAFHEPADQALRSLIIQRIVRYVKVPQIALANDLLPPLKRLSTYSIRRNVEVPECSVPREPLCNRLRAFIVHVCVLDL